MTLLALCAFAACQPATETADVVIRNVTVYTGNGETIVGADVVVRDGVFLAIEADAAKRFKAPQVIDGGDRFLMPGLWEMHGHVADVQTGALDPKKFLQYGITALRDTGGHTEQVRAISQITANDESAGPYIYYVGTTLNGEQFASFQRALTTVDEVGPAVRTLVADGASQIKIHRATLPEVFPEILAAAHREGMTVTGHIPLGVAPLDACDLGIDGIEHVGSLLESHISVQEGDTRDIESAIAFFLSEEAAPIFECLARRGVFVNPTLVVYPAVAKSRGYDPLPPELAAQVRDLQEIVNRLYDSGVPLLVGTDAATVGPMKIPPGTSYHDELAMLQDAGIPATAIIRMATHNASIAVGAADVRGTIEPDKAADFLLLSGDPGEDIRNTGRIDAVFRNGVQVGPQMR